jgi:hypothetical protein
VPRLVGAEEIARERGGIPYNQGRKRLGSGAILDDEAAEWGAPIHGSQRNFRVINVKLDRYILRSTIVAVLSGLLFGLDTGVLACEVTLSDRSTHL